MKDEVTQLWKIERPLATQVVLDAAKNGNRSKNEDSLKELQFVYYF